MKNKSHYTEFVNAADEYAVADRSAGSVDIALGNDGGAIGDYLNGVTVSVSPVTTTLKIYDGTVAGGTLVLEIPVGQAVGTYYQLGIRSKVGAWTVDDDANNGAVICSGLFT